MRATTASVQRHDDPGALVTTGPGATSSAEADERGRDAYRSFVRPRIMELLASIGLDVVYHRGEGDYLFYREAGREIRVLDLAGGFGASLFGHNHPELVARAIEVLSERRPFNAQASARPRAGELARRLSALVGETTGRSYVATFASTGAEAAEAALKHAELESWERRRTLLDRLSESAILVRQQVAAGQAVVEDGLLASAASRLGLPACLTLDELGRAIVQRLRDQLRRPPTFLALRGAFHGKTAGALRLTHNLEYRQPWERSGSALFVTRDDVDELRAAIATTRLEYGQLEVEGSHVRLATRHFHDISAAFVEPIQGEGGIHELAPSYSAELRRLADDCGFPLVIDEIQSGMGRTGTFLASQPLGVRGDYYLLAKSLGGGLAKISALLVDQRRYRPDFGYLHTSTFADDDFSCTVALAALDLLERDHRDLLRRCADKGQYLLQRLTALRAQYPGQLRGIRGRGLMIGLELQPQLRSRSPLLRMLSEQRLLGYFAAGYLLHEERIRVAPTLSAHGTIRIEPSADIAMDELDRVCDAFERLCVAIRDLDVERLVRLGAGERALRSIGGDAGADRGAPATPPPEEPAHPTRPLHTPQPVAFLLHYMTPDDLVRFEPGLRHLDDPACRTFIERTRRVLRPFVARRATIRSRTGDAVDLSIIAVPFSAEQATAALRDRTLGWAIDMVKDAVGQARSLGCVSVGLGGYTSIVTNNCRAIVTDDIGVTSGNSLTVAAAVDALFAAAVRHGVPPRRLGVVGAAGNIGAMIAEQASSRVDEIVLIGRTGTTQHLARLAARLPCRTAVADDLAALGTCSLVISASNSPSPIIFPEHIDGAAPVVVCDVAVPGDVDRALIVRRGNARLIGGGLLRLPEGQDLGRFGVAGAPGVIYACMAETILLGCAGIREHFSYGPLRADRVDQIRQLAASHGLTVEEKPL